MTLDKSPYRVQHVSLHLKQMKLQGYIGIHARERRKKQPLLLTLSVDLPSEVTTPLLAKPSLQKTVDYEAIYHNMHRLLTGRHYALLEELAWEIAKTVLQNVNIARVDVHLHKPRALRHALAGCSLSVTRTT